jgi:hypothetical protein
MATINTSMKVHGTKLIIEVDLLKEFGESASGKSMVIASSSGNVSLKPAKADFAALKAAGVTDPESIRIGVNVFRKIGVPAEQTA